MDSQNEAVLSGDLNNYCPQCNSSYDHTKKFCGKCGIPLVAGSSITAGSDSFQVSSIPESSGYDESIEQSLSTSGANSKSPIVAIVIVSLIAVAGFVYGPKMMTKVNSGNSVQQVAISYINKEVILRQGPGSKTPQVGKLPVNTQVAVIGLGTGSKDDLWSQVRVESGSLQGQIGYVKPKYLNGR